METDQQPFYSRAAAGGTAAVGERPPARTDRFDQGPLAGAVREALALLLEPGSVAELRAIGRDGRVASGYFNATALLAAKAVALDDSGDYAGVYVTLNPVAPALLARRANRVVSRLGSREATTSDGDILRRRWLPVDIDPVRPSGISATDAEREAAFAVARAIRDRLAAEGWPAPVEADSGNGAHLLYRVDLPNDGGATALVKGVLAALDARFSNGAAKVDTANHNAARIWKLYGTVCRKGDSTPDRPHRRSAVVSRPFEPEVVPVGALRALAASMPPPDPPSSPTAARARRVSGFDLGAWLAEHGIAVASGKPWQGGTLYDLEQCPFSDAHRDGAYAVRFPDGGVLVACHHASCGGGRQRWPELRARFEPAAQATPPAPEAETDAAGAAAEVLERGDPLAYFLATYARDHVGDETLAHCLVMSAASPAVLNSRGLHVYVTGGSGKGKSSGMAAMYRQLPDGFRRAERLSDKALYYADDVSPGTVLLLDDIALSPELQEVLKEATSRFTERIEMLTVDTDRKVRRLAIPERCVWWLATVQTLYDDQVMNRMLTSWIDDSEAQDREVFSRLLADGARPAREGVAGRFDLLVCQEIWRAVRAAGPVYVEVPFATGIRMSSVANRRNPLVLLDLVRSHALLFLRQRPSERLEDGTLAVTATLEDFRYAAGLFSSLHATAGSLGSKFDRDQDRVLAEAARRGVERFTVRDLQQWTGWTDSKARRTMLGYVSRGVRYPGLLDRSPALSLEDQTTSDPDDEGRRVQKRQRVFLFDPEVYRESREQGLAWLESGAADGGAGCRPPATDAAADPIEGRGVEETGIGDDTGEMAMGPGSTRGSGVPGAPPEETPFSPPAVRIYAETGDSGPDPLSGRLMASAIRAAPSAAAMQQGDCCRLPGPRAFAPLDEPAPAPCSACGRQPSHFREVRGDRHLCRACHGAAVRREQRAGPPLPAVIETDALVPVTAPVGRCDVCDLEKASFSGGGVRLCGACFDRESRRRVREGGGGSG